MGYPIFIDKYLKPVQIGLFQMLALFFCNITSLKLAKSNQFFFHANYRMRVCNTTTKCFGCNLIFVHVNMSWALGLKWF